jgi:uncharacterized protein YaiI (UPF0178 family)
MKIIVDADACPVMDEVMDMAHENELHVLFVADYSHVIEYDSPLVDVRLVERAPDAVDMCIINECEGNDIVVTRDIGLASLILGKGGRALSPTGKTYSPDNIDDLLERRHRSRVLRRAGARLRGGPPPFTDRDRTNFIKTLTRLLKEV